METRRSKVAPFDDFRRGAALALALRAITAPRRYIRPWYLAYLLLGMVTSGLLPVLLPLTVEGLSHSLATVAYVMGAYNFGLLTSPLWGMLAERIKAYRKLFLGSFLLTAAGTLGMLALRGLPSWLVAAFALGAGSGGAATLATLFIVDFAPRTEWEPRIGWLQTFNAAGQVAGLMLAAAFTGGDFAPALWVCVTFLLLAMAVGGIGLPGSPGASGDATEPPHLHLNVRALALFPKLILPSGIDLHVYHLNLHGLRRLPQTLGTPFGRFLLSWFVFAFAVAAFFSYFPLMLAEGYGIAAHTSAMIYALTAALGIGLYVLTSRLTARYGPGRVYRAGLVLRISGFGLLLAPFVIAMGGRSLLGALGFALIGALSSAQAQDKTFKQEQLDQILAPIALYPDSLLSQVLMASTYPVDVAAAAKWSKDHLKDKEKGDRKKDDRKRDTGEATGGWRRRRRRQAAASA